MAPQQRRYKLKASDDTAAFTRDLHPQIKQKIRAALKIILENPDAGKALRDELAGLKSFRVGKFRIVYRMVQRNIIEIVTIGPRKTIYEETYRLLHKKP